MEMNTRNLKFLIVFTSFYNFVFYVVGAVKKIDVGFVISVDNRQELNKQIELLKALLLKVKKQYVENIFKFSITRENNPKVLKKLDDNQGNNGDGAEQSFREMTNFLEKSITVRTISCDFHDYFRKIIRNLNRNQF